MTSRGEPASLTIKVYPNVRASTRARCSNARRSPSCKSGKAESATATEAARSSSCSASWIIARVVATRFWPSRYFCCCHEYQPARVPTPIAPAVHTKATVQSHAFNESAVFRRGGESPQHARPQRRRKIDADYTPKIIGHHVGTWQYQSSLRGISSLCGVHL